MTSILFLLPRSCVFVLANPTDSVWLRNRNPSSGNGETGSVISSKEVKSLKRIIKGESESLKLWAHRATSKPDMVYMEPAVSLERNLGSQLELMVACIIVAYSQLDISEIRYSVWDFDYKTNTKGYVSISQIQQSVRGFIFKDIKPKLILTKHKEVLRITVRQITVNFWKKKLKHGESPE